METVTIHTKDNRVTPVIGKELCTISVDNPDILLAKYLADCQTEMLVIPIDQSYTFRDSRSSPSILR